MKKQTKYEINLDKPLMFISYCVLAFLFVSAWNDKNMIDLIAFSCLLIILTLLVIRDYKTYKPFIVKAISPDSYKLIHKGGV